MQALWELLARQEVYKFLTKGDANNHSCEEISENRHYEKKGS